MVRYNENEEMFIKFLYWGPAGCGKTTAIDTMYQLSKEVANSEISPTQDLVKIAMRTGQTLYFDRGVFQSTSKNNIFYHIYTVAGQERFFALRKKVFAGTDGVIFMFDGQRTRMQENLDSLRELKHVTGSKLINQIPLVIMINKQDLPNVMKKKEVEQILQVEGLFFEPDHSLYMWNPIIYETIALRQTAHNIFQVFSELARRFTLYQVYGQGSAPDLMTQKKVVPSQR